MSDKNNMKNLKNIICSLGDGQSNFGDSKIKIKQIRSGAGTTKSQVGTLRGLGLNKIGKITIVDMTPANLGMINKVKHLLHIV